MTIVADILISIIGALPLLGLRFYWGRLHRISKTLSDTQKDGYRDSARDAWRDMVLGFSITITYALVVTIFYTLQLWPTIMETFASRPTIIIPIILLVVMPLAFTLIMLFRSIFCASLGGGWK